MCPMSRLTVGVRLTKRTAKPERVVRTTCDSIGTSVVPGKYDARSQIVRPSRAGAEQRSISIPELEMFCTSPTPSKASPRYSAGARSEKRVAGRSLASVLVMPDVAWLFRGKGCALRIGADPARLKPYAGAG